MCASFTDAGVFCERCEEIKEAEDFVSNKVSEMDAMLADDERKQLGISPDEPALEAKPTRGGKWLKWSAALLVPLYLGLLVYSNPGIFEFDSAERVRREAAQALENCVYIFQEIGMYLEEGRSPPPNLRCEEVSTVNIFTRDGDEVRVSHPNPQYHGYRQIYVTNQDHEPVLVR